MKFLYCLASLENDTYLEELLCSVTSLRYYNKNAFVSLLIDDLTAKSLVGFRASIKDMVNELKIVEYPKNMSLRNRSRLLKTGARNLVAGDFLYIDCDAVVCSELNQNELPDCEIGAVQDFHMSLENHKKISSDYFNKIKIMNFVEPSNNKYFNSGVLFVKDSRLTRDFFLHWQELYNKYANNGLFWDQPALCQTNIKFNYIINELDGIWNNMFLYDINYIHKAKIMHFWATRKVDKPNTQVHPLMEKTFYEKIKKEQKINGEQLNIILNPKENFYPNISPTRIINKTEQTVRLYDTVSLYADKRLTLWGAGILGKKNATNMNMLGIKFEITDINPKLHGERIAGVVVKSWDELKENTDIVLVCAKGIFDEVKEKLSKECPNIEVVDLME